MVSGHLTYADKWHWRASSGPQDILMVRMRGREGGREGGWEGGKITVLKRNESLVH